MGSLGTHDRCDFTTHARVNTFGEPEDDLNQQLEYASHTRKAIRSYLTWNSNLSKHDFADNLHRARASIRRKTGSSKLHSNQSIYKYEPNDRSQNWERALSVSSSSTLDREGETTTSKRWRGSPVSPLGPCTLASYSYGDRRSIPEDPCPAIRGYTTKQARKEVKQYEKSFKQQEKQRRKLEKEAVRFRQKTLAVQSPAAVGDVESQVSAAQGIASADKSVQNSEISKSTKMALVKKPTLKEPLLKLTHRLKKTKKQSAATKDKSINSAVCANVSASGPRDITVAELPATLPAYTVFEDSTATLDNKPLVLSDVARHQPEPVQNIVVLAPTGTPSPGPLKTPKTMRCDSCQFGIKIDDLYYHCSICDDGDRIICNACQISGLSCRHKLTEKVRSVFRSAATSRTTSNSSCRSSGRQRYRSRSARSNGSSHSSSASAPSRTPSDDGNCSDNDPWHTRSFPSFDNLTDRSRALELRAQELHIRAQERQATIREREDRFREREAYMRERQALLQEKADMLEERASLMFQQMDVRFAWQNSDFINPMDSHLQGFKEDPSNSLSPSSSYPTSQDADAASVNLDSVSVVSRCNDATSRQMSEEGFWEKPDFDILSDPGVRTHTTKRKSANTCSEQPASSASRGGKSSFRSYLDRRALKNDDEGDHNDESDEYPSDDPVQIKREVENKIPPNKLFACPFSKFDYLRYSGHNVAEKKYRGCSTGYWPDVPRLKQHLYRVHWRGHHCHRCFKKFKTETQLAEHFQQVKPCSPQDCPYEEKFGEDKYQAIKRKRPTIYAEEVQDTKRTQPTAHAEEVWYIIYEILFPGSPRPQSPYTDADSHENLSNNLDQSLVRDICEQFIAVLESDLNSFQDLTDEPWLFSERRNFLSAQFQESKAKFLQRLKLEDNSQGCSNSIEISPRTAPKSEPSSDRRGSLLQTPTSSLSTSPMPVSASSSSSSASWQQQQNSSQRSQFRRLILPKLSQKSISNVTANAQQDPMRSVVQDLRSTENTFRSTNLHNLQNESYNRESQSWQQRNEAALHPEMMVNNFNSNCGQSTAFSTSEASAQEQPHRQFAPILSMPQSYQRNPAPLPTNPRADLNSTNPGGCNNPFHRGSSSAQYQQTNTFLPPPPPPAQPRNNNPYWSSSTAANLRPHRSNASLDSGYGSLLSRHSTSASSTAYEFVKRESSEASKSAIRRGKRRIPHHQPSRPSYRGEPMIIDNDSFPSGYQQPSIPSALPELFIIHSEATTASNAQSSNAFATNDNVWFDEFLEERYTAADQTGGGSQMAPPPAPSSASSSSRKAPGA